MGIESLLNVGLGPLKVKIWLAIVAGLAVFAGIVVMIADNRDRRMVETARQNGEATAIIVGQQDTFKQLERANDAEDEIMRSGDAGRYDRCLRNASPASRANCARFKPVPD